MHKRLFLRGSITENAVLAIVSYSYEGFMKKNGRWILGTTKKGKILISRHITLTL